MGLSISYFTADRVGQPLGSKTKFNVTLKSDILIPCPSMNRKLTVHLVILILCVH